MFWNDEKIKWYLVASEYTEYHKNMAEVFKSIIPKGESLIDFGCGLSILPTEINEHFSNIVGVDYDENVLNYLNERILEKGIKNYKTICSNCYNGELVFKLENKDNILFSHFGNIEEYFLNFQKFFNKRMIIVRNDSGNKVVHNPNKNTVSDVCKYLDSIGIKYELHKQTFEFGQPLKDEKEVNYYLEKWYGDNGVSLLSNVKDIDYVYSGERFTKFYSKPKSTGIIVIKKENLYE